jgi:hypothetical protein
MLLHTRFASEVVDIKPFIIEVNTDVLVANESEEVETIVVVANIPFTVLDNIFPEVVAIFVIVVVGTEVVAITPFTLNDNIPVEVA